MTLERNPGNVRCAIKSSTRHHNFKPISETTVERKHTDGRQVTKPTRKPTLATKHTNGKQAIKPIRELTLATKHTNRGQVTKPMREPTPKTKHTNGRNMTQNRSLAHLRERNHLNVMFVVRTSVRPQI